MKYQSILQGKTYTSEIVINKSRFLGFARFVEQQDEAEDFLKDLHQKYSDARHICYAYKLLNTAKQSDDGEPSGTAGKPILNIIEKKGLQNIIIVVVRYFGGIKLGAGGLLRAYSNTATETLDSAEIAEYENAIKYSLTLPYSDYENFLNKIKNRKIKILSSNFENGVQLDLVAAESESIENATAIGHTTMCFKEKK